MISNVKDLEMSTIRIRVVALAFASVCALTACSGGGEQTTPAPADPQPTATSTDQAPAPEQSGTPPQGGQGRMPGASGLIAEVKDETAYVQGSDGQTAVTWKGDTAFTQQVTAATSDIAVGSCVVAMGEAGDDGVIAATTVTLSEAVDGECAQGFGGMGGGGGLPGGGTPPSGMPEGGMPSGMPEGGMPSGMPEDGERPSGGPGGGFGGFAVGLVTAVDGDTITVEGAGLGQDAEATTSTVTLGGSTVVTTTAEASADDVEAGLCVTAMGEVDDVGAVTAATMQLSEPTDGQCGGGFRR
jgi:hypothetical protein